MASIFFFHCKCNSKGGYCSTHFILKSPQPPLYQSSIVKIVAKGYHKYCTTTRTMITNADGIMLQLLLLFFAVLCEPSKKVGSTVFYVPKVADQAGIHKHYFGLAAPSKDSSVHVTIVCGEPAYS